jgi:hypothetical protein
MIILKCLLFILKKIFYHDVLLLVIAGSVERWTGVGKVPCSAAGEVLCHKQVSTEGHRGKSLSCCSHYFHDLKFIW